jgi:AraC-like DNA-binding protein
MDRILVNESYTTDLSVKHNISTTWTMANFHFHDLYEIYFCLSDGIRCFVNDRLYNVNKNDLFLFSSEDFHKLVVPQGHLYDRYVLLFSPQYIDILSTDSTDLLKCFKNTSSNSYHQIHFSDEDAEAFKILLYRAESYCMSKEYGSDVSKRLILAEILIFINEFYENNAAVPTVQQDSTYSKVKSIISFIDENISENITLDYLSTKFYISKYYLERIFKQATGCSVNEYIINKRILNSKKFLRDNMPVSQVAEIIGFNSDSHFIRTFKKLVGITPKQYAKSIE